MVGEGDARKQTTSPDCCLTVGPEEKPAYCSAHNDPFTSTCQPANGIVIRPFDGDTSDTELADLLEFLKAAACSPTDLRKFVEKYGGGDQDVGRRYLLQKQEQDKLVESRRSLGRAFGKNPAIGAPPGQFGGFGNMR